MLPVPRMITAATAGEAVAAHYDDLDPFYRSLWGEHVHHGLWRTGRETPAQAALALSREVVHRLRLQPGDHVCDVGCGYGGTARYLVNEHRAEVTAITISARQHAEAIALNGGAANPRYLLGDWMENDQPDSAYQAVIAIESTEHLPDVARGIREMARVLAPGGRLVICAWMAGPGLRPWERKYLLEPICREGCLVGMGDEDDYRGWIAAAGLQMESVDDFSREVRRTWPICIRRTIGAFFRDPATRRFLLDDHQRNRVFALTLLRIWFAYFTGAMRYTIFTAIR